MRRIRMIAGLAAMVCALAVVAAPASAVEFSASAVGKSLPLKLTASGEEQAIKFGKYKVECESTKGQGTIASSPTPTLTVSVRYKQCKDVEGRWEGVETEPKVSISPVELTYYGNGSVGVQEVEISPITIKIHNTGGCTVTWERQRVPVKAAEKENLEYSSAEPIQEFETGLNPIKYPPFGEREEILFEDHFKNMTFEYGHRGLCENFATGQQKGGKLEGEMLVAVQGGDLSFH
jgi:hypothetical protein